MTNECLITLRSATYSMKAQRILSENRIPVRTVKLDGEYAERGCTHGIRFDCRYRQLAERLLKEQNISYSAVRSE